MATSRGKVPCPPVGRPRCPWTSLTIRRRIRKPKRAGAPLWEGLPSDTHRRAGRAPDEVERKTIRDREHVKAMVRQISTSMQPNLICRVRFPGTDPSITTRPGGRGVHTWSGGMIGRHEPAVPG